MVRQLCDCDRPVNKLNNPSEHDRICWIIGRALYKWKVLSLLKS